MILTEISEHDLTRLVGQERAEKISIMLDRIQAHRPTHIERKCLLDGSAKMKSLNLSIPPHLNNMNVSVGWTGRFVESVSQRLVFDGVSIPGRELSDYGLDTIIEENQLHHESRRVHYGALWQAVNFQVILRGDVERGEPEIVIQTFDAMMATGLHSEAKKRLEAALTILNENSDQGLTRFIAYFDDAKFDFKKSHLGIWHVDAYEEELGRTPVVPFVYNRQVDRWFGRSIITKDMMDIVNAAMRTMARNEIAAELYSVPQRYILGADMDMFFDEKGNQINSFDLMTEMLAIPADDRTGETPTVGTFTAYSPEAGIRQLEGLAKQFASLARLPASEFGVEYANPASADAITASRESLYKLVEDAQADFGFAHRQVLLMAVELLLGADAVDTDLKKMVINWRRAETNSLAAVGDYTMKMVSAGILPAQSEITWRAAGMSESQIAALLSDQQRHAAVNRLASLLGDSPAGDSTPVETDNVVE